MVLSIGKHIATKNGESNIFHDIKVVIKMFTYITSGSELSRSQQPIMSSVALHPEILRVMLEA